MRHLIRSTFAAAVLLPLVAHATTTAVSNLANTQTGSALVDSAQFGASTAGYFVTGSTSQSLAGATLRFNSVPTAYANFAVAIYPDSGGAFGTPVGSPVVTLVGSAPTGTGDFSFTDPSGTSLAPNTKYWLAASTTSGSGLWATTTDFAEASPIGWTIGNTLSQQSNFNHFWQTSGGSQPLFSIDVVSAPEPTTLALVAIGGLVARRRRTVC